MRVINKLKSIKQGIQDSFLTHIIDETNNNHRYQVVRCLSSDIDGSSFLVRCDKTQQLYTCKRCINKTKQTSEYFIKKLHVEYSVTSNLDHPNIIKFYDIIKHKNEWFALTEYASDGSLFDKCKKDLSMHEIEIYFKQLIDGLDYLHTKGIAHRNIKLENLLITDNKIKISNFSHADVFRVIHDYEKRFSRGIIGSGPYVAPEIYLNERYDGEAADIWSCGIVLHAMLFRHFPFKKAHKTNTSYVRFMQNREYEGNYLSRLPNEVQGLLVGMLDPSPNKRCRLSKIKNNRWFKGITEDV